MGDTQDEWIEEVSKLYQEIAPVAVPARAEQIATLLTLLPFSPTDEFKGVQFFSTPKGAIGYFCHEFTRISLIFFFFRVNLC